MCNVCSFCVECFQFCREMLTLFDGGEVALDWVLNESSTVPSELRPTVIIMPGFVGQFFCICSSEPVSVLSRIVEQKRHIMPSLY